MTDLSRGRGWSLLANDEVVPIIAGVLALDPDESYTRSEFAEIVDVPLKTLYLIDTLDELETAGMIERVDDEQAETKFRIDQESEVYRAALEFDRVVETALDGDAYTGRWDD